MRVAEAGTSTGTLRCGYRAGGGLPYQHGTVVGAQGSGHHLGGRTRVAVHQQHHRQLLGAHVAGRHLVCHVAALVRAALGQDVVGEEASKELVRGQNAAAAVVPQVQDQRRGTLRVKLVQAPVQVGQHVGAAADGRPCHDELREAQVANPAREQS